MRVCHCGAPVVVHDDLDGFTRGLCERCDLVRCDAYPGACADIAPRVCPHGVDPDWCDACFDAALAAAAPEEGL